MSHDAYKGDTLNGRRSLSDVEEGAGTQSQLPRQLSRRHEPLKRSEEAWTDRITLLVANRRE